MHKHILMRLLNAFVIEENNLLIPRMLAPFD